MKTNQVTYTSRECQASALSIYVTYIVCSLLMRFDVTYELPVALFAISETCACITKVHDLLEKCKYALRLQRNRVKFEINNKNNSPGFLDVPKDVTFRSCEIVE